MTQLTVHAPSRTAGSDTGTGTAGATAPRPPLLARAKQSLASAGVRRPRALRGERTEIPFDAPSIRTERLLLRPHRMSDADDWFAVQSEKSVTEYLPWPERDRRQSARHLRDRLRHTRLWQAEDFLALGLEHEGRLIGDVSLQLHTVAAETRTAEIGWVLHPLFGGRGLATEAAGRMLDFAFGRVRAQRVTAVTDARNLRSMALATRLGFERVPAERSSVPAGSHEVEFQLMCPSNGSHPMGTRG